MILNKKLLLLLIIPIIFINLEKIFFYKIYFSIISIFLIWFYFLIKKKIYLIQFFFFLYQSLTLILPIIFIFLFYSKNEIKSYLDHFDLSIEHIFRVTQIIFLFNIIYVVSDYFFSKKKFNIKINFNYNFKNFYLNISTVNLISFFILFSISCKLILILSGEWFMIRNSGSFNKSFLNLLNVLSNSDFVLYLYYCFYIKNLNKISNFIIILFFISLILAIVSFSKFKVILLFLIFLVFIFLKFKNYFKYFIVLFVILMLPFFQIINDVRNKIYNNKAITIATLKKDFFSRKNSPILNFSFLNRINQSITIAKTVRYLNWLQKRDYNFSLKNNLTGLVPRVIWKSKPRVSPNYHQFGKDINLINYSYSVGSVSPLIYGEVLINFGILGLLILPIIVCLIHHFMNNLFSSQNPYCATMNFFYSVNFSKISTLSLLFPFFFSTLVLYSSIIFFLQMGKNEKK